MSKTLSDKQYKSLITKSKVGWACFYQAEKLNHDLHMEHMTTLKKLEKMIEERDAPLYEKSQVPEFIKTELTELIGKLKVEVSCPICFDDLDSKDIKFSSCGHKFCETCLSKINECAICRKKIYHKKI